VGGRQSRKVARKLLCGCIARQSYAMTLDVVAHEEDRKNVLSLIVFGGR
jgi:hypothetical protein